MHTRNLCSIFLAGLLSCPVHGVAEQGAAPPDELKIIILDGDGATNNIRQRTAREPIVQVEDENHNRVPGALVVFTLPGNGPGATFLDGSKILTVTADSEGKAVARGLRPNNITGKFEIRVSASHQGKTGHTVIAQENIGALAAHHTTAKWITIAAVAAGGLAGGIYAASNNGGGPKVAPAPSLTPGVGTVGPPR